MYLSKIIMNKNLMISIDENSQKSDDEPMVVQQVVQMAESDSASDDVPQVVTGIVDEVDMKEEDDEGSNDGNEASENKSTSNV